MSEPSQKNDAPDDGSTTDMQPGSTRRERNKQRAQRRRERETSIERAQRREIERLRAAARRHNETPEEREIRRLNGRMRAMRRRENETEDERQRRRELNRVRMAERRRTLKHAAPGSEEEEEEEADDPAYRSSVAYAPDNADMQSTSAGARRECLGFTHPREFPFRVPDCRVSDTGVSEKSLGTFPTSRGLRAEQDAMSQAFSSLNMAIQPDMAMLFHQGRLMNMPQPAVFTPPAGTMNLGSQIPVFAHANPMPLHLPRQPAAAPAAPIVQHRFRPPRPHVRQPVLGESSNARQSLLGHAAPYPILSGQSLASMPRPRPAPQQPGPEPEPQPTPEPQQPPSTSYFYYLP
ncbi:hypothetical protein IWW37_001487 [Coemansia sp. RSA 2050]|nr:hypothetical protein IWW37_001487 [Coemansia sp. RSA 2050]KAJ2731599.1 hypothetical protein IW152_004417 [Coemansia sp. BCRC 34962]